MIKKGSAVKTVSFMIFITFFSKILGMLRDILVASKYGTGEGAVAFSTASRIPMLFFEMALGVAIASTLIPVFNEYLEKGEDEKAILFSNNFLNIIVFISGIIAVLGIIFSEQLVMLIAGGLEGQTFLLTVRLLRIMFPMIIFTGSAFTIVGILQSYGEFNIPALISFVSNLIIIVYLVFFNERFGIYGLAMAMVFGWLSQLIIQIPPLIKRRYQYRVIIDFKNEGVKKAALLAIPVLISAGVQPINSIVSIRLASFLNQGQAVAALDYAYKLYFIVIGIFTYSIVNLIFPSLSRMKGERHHEEFIKIVQTSVKAVIYILSPIMVSFIVLRVPLISFVYERGEFNAYSTGLTAMALMYYSFGMVGWGIQEIVTKVFYARHDAKTPMKISIGGICVNILLSISLVRIMGVGGLALATALSTILISMTLMLVINKKIPGIFNRQLMVFLFKVIGLSLAMAAITTGTQQILQYYLPGEGFIGKFMTLVIPGIVGVSGYLLLSLVLRIEESAMMMNLLKSKLVRREKT